jgi:hypothetical protein
MQASESEKNEKLSDSAHYPRPYIETTMEKPPSTIANNETYVPLLIYCPETVVYTGADDLPPSLSS